MTIVVDSADISQSRVANFYHDQTIFVTGGTGFLGKVLLFKLLKYCHSIAKIILLIRPKKGVAPAERLKMLLANQIYDEIRKFWPSQLDKVRGVEGDISEPHLGLSDADWKYLTGHVTTIFNSAATVKFDEELSQSVKKNVVSTQSMLNLARDISRHCDDQLQAFVHVSTAYVHSHMPDDEWIDERILPHSVISFEEYSHLTDGLVLPDIQSRPIVEQIVRPRPNTYTMTKAMSERLIFDLSQSADFQRLPISIVRPSIVVGCLTEPLAGWVDNLNGPTGIIGGTGHGLLGSMYAKRHIKPDLVPVDLVINVMLTAAAYSRTCSFDDIPVYNCTSGEFNPLTWGDVERYVIKYTNLYPMENMLSRPYATLCEDIRLDRLYRLVYHWIPAYMFEALTWVGLRRSKKSIVRTYQTITDSLNALEFFTTHEFKWRVDNVRCLDKWLDDDDADKQVFNFCHAMSHVEWDKYMDNYVLGTRCYVFNYKSDTIDRQRQQMSRMRSTAQYVRLFSLILTIFLISSLFLTSD